MVAKWGKDVQVFNAQIPGRNTIAQNNEFVWHNACMYFI